MDINPTDKSVVDIDLEKDKLPFKDGEVDHIQANDVLEHIRNLIPLMNECHRVLRENGTFYIEVPRFPHEDSVIDPTHVRFFVPDTFRYFTEYDGAQSMYHIKRWKQRDIEISDRRIKITLEK